MRRFAIIAHSGDLETPHLLRTPSQPTPANLAPPASDVDDSQVHYTLPSLLLLRLLRTGWDKLILAEISPNIMCSPSDEQAHFSAD